MAKTRALARRRVYVARPRARHKAGMTVSLALLAGLAPTAIFALDTARTQGPMGGIKALTMRLTGYNPWVGNWYMAEALKGWTPIVAGLVAHKLASNFGINRALGRAGVPFIRI